MKKTVLIGRAITYGLLIAVAYGLAVWVGPLFSTKQHAAIVGLLSIVFLISQTLNLVFLARAMGLKSLQGLRYFPKRRLKESADAARKTTLTRLGISLVCLIASGLIAAYLNAWQPMPIPVTTLTAAYSLLLIGIVLACSTLLSLVRVTKLESELIELTDRHSARNNAIKELKNDGNK